MSDYVFVYLVDPYGNIRLRYTRKDLIPVSYQDDRNLSSYMLRKHGKGYNFSIYEIWKSDTFDHWEYMTNMYPKNVRV